MLFLVVIGMIAFMPQLLDFGLLGLGIAVIAIGGALGFVAHSTKAKKAEYDEESFTVKKKTYNFSDISKVTAKAVSTGRFSSDMKIEIYINGKSVLWFCKKDEGADDFIAYMKKHNASITIDNSF